MFSNIFKGFFKNLPAYAGSIAFTALLNIPALTHADETFDTPNLTVLADKNISLLLSQMATDYAREYGVAVNVTPATPSHMQEMILNGEPADIIISAQNQALQELAQQGLLDTTSLTPLAQDYVVAVALNSVEPPKAEEDSGTTALKRWLEHALLQLPPLEEASAYWAKQALSHLGVISKTSHATTEGEWLLVLASPTNETKATSLPPVGITLSSTRQLHPKLALLAVLPTEQPVEYNSAVVVGEQMEQARKLNHHLTQAKQKQALQNWLDSAMITTSSE